MEAAIAGVATWLGGIGITGMVGGFIASVAVYAAVGAVVGGIGAAVVGGDIGKGILYGAVGGAVMGGVSGALANVGTGMATTNPLAAQGVKTASGMVDLTQKATRVGGAVAQGVGGGAGGFAISEGAGLLGQGVIGVAGSMLEGKAMEEENMAAREFAAEQAALQHERDKEMLALTQAGSKGGGGGGSDNSIEVAKISAASRAAELAEQRRQYDVARQDAMDKVETRKSALMGMRASRKQGGALPDAVGIDRQGNKDIPGLFGEATVPIEGETVVNAQGEEEQPWYGQGGV